MKFKDLFGSKAAKKDDAELGTGVWRRSHDRFRRGLDRFHQMLEGVLSEAPEYYEELVPLADKLADFLPEVRSIATQAQSIAPSSDLRIPTGTGGYLNDVNRELSRAGNALAAAAESIALVRLGAGDVTGVERKVLLVQEHVAKAKAILTNAGQA